METKERSRKKGLKGGIFFYIFNLGFAYVAIFLLYLVTQLIMTGYADKKLLSKVVIIFFSYLGALWKFRKNRKEVLIEILGSDTDGIISLLEDTALREKVERAIDHAIKYGYKKGIKKLEKLQQGADNYDDKAVVCYVAGALYETAGDDQTALWHYNRAIQYRPCYRMAMDKVEELCGAGI